MTDSEINNTFEDDAAAVSAIRCGDAERYADLVKRHEKRVFAIAWSRLGDASLAEEAAQEAFIRGYRRLWSLGDGRKFAGWIASIARHTAINLGLRQRRELERRERWAVEQTDLAAAGEPPEPVSGETLREALAALPASHRECLVLFYVEGKSGEEAAKALGVTEAAFRVRLHRARAALREQMEHALSDSLEKLRPSRSLVPAVMAGILAGSTAKAATLGAGATLTGALAKVLPIGWLAGALAWLPLAPTVFLAWLHNRNEARNFRDPDGFRARLFRTGVRARLLWFVPLFALTLWVIPRFSAQFGVRPFYLGLGIWCGAMALVMVRQLAVIRHPFHLLSVGALVLMSTALVGVSLHWLPLSSVTGIVALGMAPGILGWRYRPLRMDYNLFLRAAARELPKSGSTRQETSGFARADLVAFARFLGGLWLIEKARWSGSELNLLLPRFRSVPLGGVSLFRGWSGGSTLVLSPSGDVTARLAPKESGQIREFLGEASADAELEERVSEVVRLAWHELRAGRRSQAEQALGQTPDQDVFKVPPALGGANRWQHRLSVTCALVLIVLSALLSFRPVWFSGLRAVQLSESEVRDALADLASSSGVRLSNGLSYELSFSVVLPARDLFTPESLRVVQREILKSSGADFTHLSPAWSNLGNNWPLTRGLASGWLHLDEIGLDASGVRSSLEARKSNGWAWPLPRYQSREAGDPYVEKIDPVALAQLQWFRDVGCLDLIERRDRSQKIASLQVLPGRTDRFPKAGEASGLFYAPGGPLLQDTYCQLAALEILGSLDLVDREACVRALLRLHRGRGYFVSPDSEESWRFNVHGDARDTYCAFESLRILGALDQVGDLPAWEFRLAHRSNGTEANRQVNWDEIEAWAARARFNQYWAGRQQRPSGNALKQRE